MSSPHEPAAVTDVPSQLLWLHDAPLFIDEDQVERFYDAVVRPTSKTAKLTSTAGDEVRAGYTGKASGEFKMSTGTFLSTIQAWFPSLEGKAGLEAGASRDRTTREQMAAEYIPIDTPQRQLLLLTYHYLTLHNTGKASRLYLVGDPSNEVWRTPEYIAAVPRSLIFLDLPGEADARSPTVPTMLIPTAAEVEGKGVIRLYEKVPGSAEAGKYPEKAASVAELRELRKAYWLKFKEHFSATRAMGVVEDEVRDGRIRWIDFRLPITDQGDTLHLHVCPHGEYDIGVFAYNFIKRGFKHGVRLVGTLKSEPDMNVLAIYDR